MKGIVSTLSFKVVCCMSVCRMSYNTKPVKLLQEVLPQLTFSVDLLSVGGKSQPQVEDGAQVPMLLRDLHQTPVDGCSSHCVLENVTTMSFTRSVSDRSYHTTPQTPEPWCFVCPGSRDRRTASPANFIT